jgi:hypothetical protein
MIIILLPEIAIKISRSSFKIAYPEHTPPDQELWERLLAAINA